MKKYLYPLLFISLNVFCQNIQVLNVNKKFVFDSIIQKIKTKRIICLGETEHGIETFSKLKVELIKYLHDNLGYEVLAFEGSMFKISNAYYNINDPKLALKNSLYGIWQTESLLDLFQFVENNKVNKPIILSGFDVKSGNANLTSLWLKCILQNINMSYAKLIYTTDTSFINKTTPYDHQNKLQTISNNESQFFKIVYNSVLDTLNLYTNFILKKNILTEVQLKIIKQCVLNRIQLAKFVTFTKIQEASKYRDSVMCQNLLWLINDMYKDKKIIIWAADDHISKKTIKGYLYFNQKSSIEMLPNDLKTEIETISLTYLKHAPKNIKNQIKKINGNAFFIPNPSYMNGEFEGVIYFKETESIAKYKLK